MESEKKKILEVIDEEDLESKISETEDIVEEVFCVEDLQT